MVAIPAIDCNGTREHGDRNFINSALYHISDMLTSLIYLTRSDLMSAMVREKFLCFLKKFIITNRLQTWGKHLAQMLEALL